MMNIHGCLELGGAVALTLLVVVFLDGGCGCGFLMLGRLLSTLFRRLPWQPSLSVYSLGIVSCVPAYIMTNGHGNGATLLRLTLSRFAHALPPALTGWVEPVVFGLPAFFAWTAWILCRLENPVRKDAPAVRRHPPSDTVWPPPPIDPAAPGEPAEPPAVRSRNGWFKNHGLG